MQCNTMQCNRRQYNTCNTKKYHVIPYLSRLKPQLGRWGLFSQAGWFHMGCNSAGWAGRSVVMLWTPHKAIFRTQKISHKNGAMEIWDIWAKMGPFWAPGGPEGTYQVKVSGDHESNSGRPVVCCIIICQTSTLRCKRLKIGQFSCCPFFEMSICSEFTSVAQVPSIHCLCCRWIAT